MNNLSKLEKCRKRFELAMKIVRLEYGVENDMV